MLLTGIMGAVVALQVLSHDRTIIAFLLLASGEPVPND